MGYIGRGPVKSGAFRIIDDISSSFNGSTQGFTVQHNSSNITPGTEQNLLIAVDGVMQEPVDAFTISGSTITFTSAPASGASFWGVELGDVGGVASTVANGTVGTTGLASDAVDGTKIADNAINSEHYTDASIDTAHIGNLQITNALMADDAVGADELAANAVVDASIASNAAIAFSKMENLTASRLLVSDGNGDVSVSSVTTTNLTDLTDAGETALHTHAGGGSAISRVGGNTTEATTTSTTVVDMITVSGISITGPTPIWNIWKIRKTTGAADNTISGIKLHGTNLNTRISSTTTNRAENSLAHVLFGPRISSYNGGEHYFISDAEEGTFSPLSGDGDPGGATTSTVTSIATVGETDHSSITLGHDELHIYSYTTS